MRIESVQAGEGNQVTEVYDFTTGQSYDANPKPNANRPLWESPEQEAHVRAVVRLNPRWEWAVVAGKSEAEAPLHYAARIAHLAGLLDEAPDPYHCGKTGDCEACDRGTKDAPASDEREENWWDK